jgi:hypothetical protein
MVRGETPRQGGRVRTFLGLMKHSPPTPLSVSPQTRPHTSPALDSRQAQRACKPFGSVPLTIANGEIRK